MHKSPQDKSHAQSATALRFAARFACRRFAPCLLPAKITAHSRRPQSQNTPHPPADIAAHTAQGPAHPSQPASARRQHYRTATPDAEHRLASTLCQPLPSVARCAHSRRLTLRPTQDRRVSKSL